MPKLLKNGTLIDDPWTVATADAPIGEGQVIITADRLSETTRTGLGLHLPNSYDVESLVPELARLALIILEFPKFTDGRAFSQARKLREQGFKGELRATGQVLPDQILFMRRCGFDAFILAKGDPIAAWSRAGTLYSGFYQPAADGVSPAFLRRQAS